MSIQPLHALPLLLLLLPACQTETKQSAQTNQGDPTRFDKPPAPPKPWTDAFEKPAMLFADEVRIEGPEGMLDHCALRNELVAHQASATTTAEGFLQETTVLPGAESEIHAYLDHWELVAFKRVVLFERAAGGDVRVIASGDVRFVDRTTNQEQHGARLVFEGPIRR